MHDSKYICFSQRVLYILNDWLLSNIYSNFICIYSRFTFPVYTTYIDWKMTRINRHLPNRYWLVHERLEILLMSCNFTRINVNNIFTVTIDIDTICLILQYTLYSEFLKCYIIISAERPSAYLFICRYVDALDWLAINRLLQRVKARIKCSTCPFVNGADKSIKFVWYNFTQFGCFCWSD